MHIRLFLIISILFTLVGCGDSTSLPVTSTPTPIDNTPFKEGIFIGPLVNGLHYETESVSGVTTNGTFKYKDGEIIQFKLGNIYFDKIYAKELISPLDFEHSINIARLLQTIDDDGQPNNGITITDAVINELQQFPDVISKVDDYSEEISISTQFNSAGRQELVTPANATELLYKTYTYSNVVANVISITSLKTNPLTDTTYNQPYPEEILSLYPYLPSNKMGIEIIVPKGTSVHSLTSGIVSRVDHEFGRVYIKPQNSEGTLVYNHLSEIGVSKDDVVEKKQLLGKSGGLDGYLNYLELIWLKDESYLPEETSPDMPSIEVDNGDIRGYTYDLQLFSTNSEVSPRSSLFGIWGFTTYHVENNSRGVSATLTLSPSGDSQFTELLFTDSECGRLEAKMEADVSVEVENRSLYLVFDNDSNENKATCEVDGSWVKTGHYPKGFRLELVLKASYNNVVLQDLRCNYFDFGSDICLIENQSFKQVSIVGSNSDFSVRNIPLYMRELGWYLGEELLEHWFVGNGETKIIDIHDVLDISETLTSDIDELEQNAIDKTFLTEERKAFLIAELEKVTNSQGEPILSFGGKFDFISSELELAGNTHRSIGWERNNLHFIFERRVCPSRRRLPFGTYLCPTPLISLSAEHAALNRYAVRVVLAGNVSVDNGIVEVTVRKAGIYLRDSFDMIGNQALGYWRSTSPYVKLWNLNWTEVENKSFRDYKEENHLLNAGDYMIYTNPENYSIDIDESFYIN